MSRRVNKVINHQVFKGICVCYDVILLLTKLKYGYFDSCHKNIVSCTTTIPKIINKNRMQI